MRQVFINTLVNLAVDDKDLYLLTADMGFGLVEQFATRFPDQYINVGVAEQNMIGVAAGLALEGKKVFCYSISNFPTMRCLEQIRNDICYHNLPVCIVSGGAGLWYGALGMSHWAVEDIAVMRCLPNMAVVSPCNEQETGQLVSDIYHRKHPCYMRMSRAGDYAPSSWSHFGGATVVLDCPSPDVVIIATGGKMLDNAVCAVEAIQKQGIGARLLSIHTIKPLDCDAIMDSVAGPRLVITIEEHSRIGGLGSAVAEVLAELEHHPPLIRMGTDDRYPDTATDYEGYLAMHHLDTDSIIKAIIDNL